MLVWVDSWQLQCCGEPFSLGTEVEWELYEYEATGDAWMTAVLGPELSRQVTHGEDRHGSAPGPTTPVKGTVRRIRAVSAAFGPPPSDPESNVRLPVPGSTELLDLKVADGWFPEDGQVFINHRLHAVLMSGYLVDLEPA